MTLQKFFLCMLLFFGAVTSCTFGQEASKIQAQSSGDFGDSLQGCLHQGHVFTTSKKRREIFGKLVPYDQVWRTGANEATELTTTKNIQINGTLLKAGTYSLFTIPQKDSWTIIINSEVGLWGAYNYNSKLDVMRFNIPPSTTDTVYESFTMQFDHRNEVADLLLYWDRTKISIPVKFIN